MGFSDELWVLLDQTWLEEFESNDVPSARPNTTSILERLQDEADNWNMTSRRPALPAPMERQISGMSYTSPDGVHAWFTCQHSDEHY
jgi:hypothetical protein